MATIRDTAAARAAAVPATTDGDAPTGSELVRRALAKWRPQIIKLLDGTGINEETFTAQIGVAYRATPGLWACDTATVLGAALKCAQLGLAPNDPRNLAWIIPYKKNGEAVATFQLGYGGTLELARRAVKGLKFDGRAVYPNDEFDIVYGRDNPLVHRPAVVFRKPAGGLAFAWYVRAVYPDGSEVVHVLDREQVEYHRAYSQQPDGQMWTDAYDAAALKSVVMDMRRFLPSSAAFAAGLAADGATMTPDQVDEPPRVEVTYKPPVADAGDDDASPTAEGAGS